ncbi:hypothetical protein I4U23_016193 [Adineta vaga]|nr:hypothetical protein I4U23_016193 [Adineta vaga]
MDSSLNLFNHSTIVYRSIEKHEQQQALDMLYSVFESISGCFQRDFSSEASPNYQNGDALGAWHNDKLVSTVFIRRLILRSNEDNLEYLCGGICDVATIPEYRRQGLSRRLLTMAIDKMEKSNAFDLSMLGTGIHNHYTTLGWEQMHQPHPVIIDWKNIIAIPTDVTWHSASDILSKNSESLLKIHSNKPRIYQIDRSPITIFQQWVTWEWQNAEAIICVEEFEGEQGYIVISKPDNETDVCVLEWRAPSLNLEKKLLSLAATEIRRRHGQTVPIRLHTLPQYMTIDQLTEWAGLVKTEINSDIMLRNIRLPDNIYNKIKEAFSDGRATHWTGDFF